MPWQRYSGSRPRCPQPPPASFNLIASQAHRIGCAKKGLSHGFSLLGYSSQAIEIFAWDEWNDLRFGCLRRLTSSSGFDLPPNRLRREPENASKHVFRVTVFL